MKTGECLKLRDCRDERGNVGTNGKSKVNRGKRTKKRNMGNGSRRARNRADKHGRIHDEEGEMALGKDTHFPQSLKVQKARH